MNPVTSNNNVRVFYDTRSTRQEFLKCYAGEMFYHMLINSFIRFFRWSIVFMLILSRFSMFICTAKSEDNMILAMTDIHWHMPSSFPSFFFYILIVLTNCLDVLCMLIIDKETVSLIFCFKENYFTYIFQWDRYSSHI